MALGRKEMGFFLGSVALGEGEGINNYATYLITSCDRVDISFFFLFFCLFQGSFEVAFLILALPSSILLLLLR